MSQTKAFLQVDFLSILSPLQKAKRLVKKKEAKSHSVGETGVAFN